MKVRLNFKTPGVLDQISEDRNEEEQREVCGKLEKWIRWGEYVTIEFDLENGTAKVEECGGRQCR